MNVDAKLVVYLDIDGTLLYDPGDGTGREDLDYQFVCEGLTELLEFVVAHCEPYWLSYRARLGRTDSLEQRLFPDLPELARQIPPAYWDRHKHEALDPSRPFLWFDDDPEDEDLTWLQQNDRQAALIRMDAYTPTNPIAILQTLKRMLPSGTDFPAQSAIGCPCEPHAPYHTFRDGWRCPAAIDTIRQA